MSFIHDIYEFKKSFRPIKKSTLKCVHLKNAKEYKLCIINKIFHTVTRGYLNTGFICHDLLNNSLNYLDFICYVAH